MQKKKVSVVIPCWNSEFQMKSNLPSVFKAAQRINAEVIVVDDASSDGSVSYLKGLKNKIRLVLNTENKGFGGTVNKGVQEARGDIVILLNTDVRPEVNCFENCLSRFDDPLVFAVGFNSGEGAMRVKWERGLFHHFRDDNPHNISLWASGGQAAFDRAKWLDLGGMDPLYAPFYWEDTDMGYRAWKRGWKVKWASDCKCIHDHKKSVIASNFSSRDIEITAQRNQFIFIWKNIGDIGLLFSHIVWLPFYIWNYPQTMKQAATMLFAVLRTRRKESTRWIKSDKDILDLWK